MRRRWSSPSERIAAPKCWAMMRRLRPLAWAAFRAASITARCWPARGVPEIVAEAQAHPALAIEHHLLFSYPRDMRFYLTPRAGQHRAVIESALKAAQASGLKRRIIAQHFGAAIRSLGLDQRRRILLQAPPVR